MKYSRNRLIAVAAASVMLGSGSPASAVSIVYQVSAVASGTLGGSPFSNSLVTLSLTADTSSVAASPICPTCVANLGTTTVNVAGIGTGTVTDATAVFATVTPFDPGSPGFPNLPYISIAVLDHPPSTATNNDIGIIGTNNLLGYDLRSPIGPIAGSGGLLYDPGLLHTTLGNLSFASPILPASQGTFVATAVPEPSNWILMCLGLAAIAAELRPRRTMSRGEPHFDGWRHIGT